MKKLILTLLLTSLIFSGCNSTTSNVEETTTKEETTDLVLSIAECDVKALHLSTIDYEIAEQTKKKIVLKSNDSFMPCKITVIASKNKGKRIEEFNLSFFNEIVESLGYKNYDSEEYPLDEIKDVALIYDIYDTSTPRSMAFIQRKNILYSFMSVPIGSDDDMTTDDTSSELVNILEGISYNY